jgi:O-antigen ligase
VSSSAALTRSVARHALAACTGFAFFVPLSAMFHQDTLSWPLRACVIVLTGLAAALPSVSLMALSLLLPMALVVSSAAGWVLSTAQISDACLLAVVAGLSLRLIGRAEGPERVRLFALAFGAAVLTSGLVELHSLNVVAPQRPVWDEVRHHLTVGYWSEPREFPLLHLVYRWLAGLALAVFVERVVRASGRNGPILVRFWIVGGVAGAALTAVAVMEQVLAGGMPAGAAFWWVMRTARVSALQPDVNAAGSYFALLLLPAVVIGWRRRDFWMLGLATPLLVLGFAVARSRAAIAALVAVACVGWASSLPRSWRTRFAIGAAAVAFAVSLALFGMTSRLHVGMEEAAVVRVQLAEAGLQAAKRHPVFGVGLGEYIPRTRRFITPDMDVLSRFAPAGENAHDNYLQILVELGIPAALLFVVLTGSVTLAGWPRARRPQLPEAHGMALGLAAFLLSALFGHPLLVPEVFGVFFLALGLTAGTTGRPGFPGGTGRWIVLGIAGFYVISLAWRVW